MPTIEDILREKTYKEFSDDIELRVFRTLNDEKDGCHMRITEMLSSVVALLHKIGLIDAKDLNAILLYCVR